MSASSTRVGLELLAKRSGQSTEAIRATFDTIIAMVEEGRSVTIPGFGRFEPSFTEPRTVKSPVLPGGEAPAPRRRKVKFAMSEALRNKWVLEAKEG